MKKNKTTYAISAMTTDKLKGHQWHEIVIETDTIKSVKTYDAMRIRAAEHMGIKSDRMIILNIFKIK
jgi:hypothetical protein